MATFTDAQKSDLARIFGTNSEELGYRLDIYAGVITDDDKTAVLADVTAFEAIEDDNINIIDKERNFGARIDPDKKRSLIKKRIAGLLHCEDFMSVGSRRVRA